MFRKAIIPLLLCIVLSVSGTISAQESDYITHTIQKGQGLYSIARMYGVTEEEIINMNPGSETVIKAGDQLRIPVRKDGVKVHTVAAGETLYSLAGKNGLTVQELCDANPGVSDNGLRAGQTIIIPNPSDRSQSVQQEQVNEAASDDSQEFMTTHVVQKKETIYKISRKYGITQAEFLNANPQFRYEKLQIGSVVNIPYPSEDKKARKGKSQKTNAADTSFVSAITIPVVIPVDTQSTVSPAVRKSGIPDVIEASLIMPFELDMPISQNQMKMVEFYQGVLLATEKMKKDGVSINLHVYDTKGENESIGHILNNEGMDKMDIIFGPKYDKHVNEAVNFATANNIPIVLPISSNLESYDGNGYVYQLNTPQSQMITDVCDHFFRQFRNPRIIFIDTKDNVRNPLVDMLQQKMKDAGKPYITFDMDYEDENIAQHLVDTLSASHQNIFMLTTGNGSQLASVLPLLQLATRTKDSAIETHLFGYPEYQIYAYDHMEELFEVDTWFYSWFYSNNRLQEAIEFDSSFHRAFGRQLMQSYPNYAAYGYDTALYFLNGIARYGTGMSDNLNRIRIKPVQMGFKFIKDDRTGCYVNHKVFFIHLSNEYKIEKKDFD